MVSSFEHTMSRRLQCPVCLELLSDPKQLSCTHTFCKKCLGDILTCSSQKTANSLACPICRIVTDVRDGNVENIKTNVRVKSLVDDVGNIQQLCDMCDSESKALHFCCECGKNMCNTCLEKHNTWPPNLKHRVVSVEDIREGKVIIKKKVFCQQHQSHDEEHVCTDVCITCKKFICERCRLIKHKDHTVQDADEYKDSFKTEMEFVQARCETKTTTIKNHMACIKSQKKRVNDHIDGRKIEIHKIYQESIKKLNDSKASLDEKLETQRVDLCQRLDEMKDADERLVTSIESARVLAGNSLKAPLDGDTIVIRDSLSCELKNVLGRDDPTKKLATDVADRAEKIIITPNKLSDIGEVRFKKCDMVAIIIWISIVTIALSALQMYFYPGDWIKKCDVELSKKGDMNCMAPTLDGRMAVGYDSGGIDIFSADGKLQQTVPIGVRIREVAFLSTGRNVVLGGSNIISLYTSQWQELYMNFQTLSLDKGGFGSLTVDSNDLIYVSYRDAKKIQVFSPAGGKAIREMPCDGYVPLQITSYNDLLISSDGWTIRMIDKKGNVKHTVEKSWFNTIMPIAAVTRDNSILIARVKQDGGWLDIDEYTNELKHIKNIISYQKIEKPRKWWYYLQVFKSGEIAFCTSDRLFEPINV